MIERDVLMRQVAELARVLAAVLARRHHDPASVQEALADGVGGALGLGLGEFRAMSRAEVEALVTDDGLVSAEKAVALADLLREDAEAAGRLRARWLYEVAVAAGGPVPFDLKARLDALPEG